jgi:hypothetical protein
MLKTALAIKALAQLGRDEGIIVSIIAHIVPVPFPSGSLGVKNRKRNTPKKHRENSSAAVESRA